MLQKISFVFRAFVVSMSANCMCVMGAAAQLVSTQHGSGEDAEAGASEADPQQQHHGFAQTQLPLQTPRVH